MMVGRVRYLILLQDLEGNGRKSKIIFLKAIFSMTSITSGKRFKSIKEFQFIGETPLGSGSFGVVRLARHRTSCRMYAVKVISSVPSETEAKLIEREILLHSQVDHPNLIKLWDTLVQEGVIYMVMEYAEGGNLFYHQNTKNIFSQPEAFRFFIQTLQGVDYLHRNDIIHRDLKPQNLLLDADSNIKICDFGWAAQDISLRRNTFCGTYQYMAPEMLFQNCYDFRVDVWALGVLLYELLHGQAPFKGSSAAQVQESILKGGYSMNPSLSEKARDLISGILQIDVGMRMTLEQIMEHPWVKTMEIHINTHLNSQKIKSPKDVYPSISKMKNLGSFAKDSVHRKNSSLNLQRETPNPIEIGGMTKKIASKFYSQQKQNQKEGKQGMKNSQSGVLRRGKMEGIKTQGNETDLHRLLQKLKTKKSAKISKELPSFEKDDGQPFFEVTNKRKPKTNKSQVDLLAEKYPVRFNTEACEQDYEPTRLKKNHLNAKLLSFSRNLVKVQKGRIESKF